MRTFYTLFVLASLVLALVATAAPPNPTLLVTCTPDAANVNCAAGTQPTFSGGGLNPHRSYAVEGVGSYTFIDSPLPADNNGNYSVLSSDGTLPAGDWTFTLWQLDKNGNLFKQVDGPYTLTFD